ncbi:MAG: 30S ribosomal protein S17 [bacterium]|nr:30S ribosomal protein S17 [bacterium]
MEPTVKKIVREFIGEVTSAASSQTVVAKVGTLKTNAKYHKQYKVSRKYHIHDAKGLAKVGDRIRFIECRPISKTKKWRLVEVITKK